MDVLLLGGPLFLGRHLIDALVAGGHRVVMANRGQTNPSDYPDIERVVLDRTKDVSALAGRAFDAAIDTSAYFPRDVRRVMDVLAGGVGHYTFVSTMSVYADLSAGVDEESPVGTVEDPESIAELTNEAYGPLKALCEAVAEEAMPGRTANVRPGLIVGPHDPSDRFTYWVRRMAAGGEALAPDRPDMAVQVIDARDLAEWIVRLAESGTTGVFNATGPDKPLRFDTVLDACREVAGPGAADTRWVEESFLLEREVGPWMELPLWLPVGAGFDGLMASDVSKAVSAGLTFRPIVDTCRDTLAWDRTRDGAGMAAQLTAEREAELLAAYATRG